VVAMRRLFQRRRNAAGRENSKERDGRDAPNVVAPPAVTPTSNGAATHTSTTSIDVPAPRPEPASRLEPTPAPAPLPPLPAPAATSTDITTVSPPERLWDRAYDSLKKEETALLQAYEKILSHKLHDDGSGSAAESQSNTIAHDPDTRRGQMKLLIDAGLDKTAREAKVKEGIGAAMDIVQSAKDIISSAVQAMPQAALAWTGVCVALEVSSSGN
jgi:N-terminal domain of NWD NACHT-NTPase